MMNIHTSKRSGLVSFKTDLNMFFFLVGFIAGI